jgi:hypothetical protein
MYRQVDVYVRVFLISAVVLGELPASRPGRFTNGKEAPGTRLLGRVIPRTGLNDVEEGKFMTLSVLEL